jgi:hypothetical protein
METRDYFIRLAMVEQKTYDKIAKEMNVKKKDAATAESQRRK